jgi:hypothetical protein
MWSWKLQGAPRKLLGGSEVLSFKWGIELTDDCSAAAAGTHAPVGARFAQGNKRGSKL